MDLRLRRSCLREAELGVVAVDNLLDGGAQEEVLQLHNMRESSVGPARGACDGRTE